MTYQHFAYIYDRLMTDAPYESWVSYAQERLPKGTTIVDVACGTGTFTLKMAQEGYNISGVDLSEEMLSVAKHKADEAKENITFVRQDMQQLSGFQNIDAVTVFCDGMNYLMEEDQVRLTFEAIAAILSDDGVLLFDVHSPYKMDTDFDYKVYAENDEDVSYIWFAQPGELENSVEHELTFFIKNEVGIYERVDEAHSQRTFDSSVYASILDDCGFEIVEISAAFGEKAPIHQTDRIFFYAKKRRK
ncbi:class I SAM-dependent DNA methyltransferase [Alteribacter populi]|uniref:class I SAM-dependent DNA methyltransferase n=1 Tax=Alteribacter populi TaxID=2011011 RepID=UPI000BBAC664|nr:class I SAM-dependent methyltransferase [Alteribacter populi]